MIIKKLTLNNFRQFTGEQSIEFSTDSSRKATLVIAENGTGKTTIIESFSWIFYDKIKIKSILNTEIKEKLASGDSTNVFGEVVLEHMGKEYSIIRTQKFTKSGNGIRNENSILRITYKDENGISKELRGINAEKEINNIVPEELFPYFFFKGENIEKIGREINTSKSTKNNEFVKAIRGMLGFTWLYQTRDDLRVVSSQYNDEIASNQTDGKLADLARRENIAESNKKKYEEEIEQLEDEISKFKERREELNKNILESGDIANKQQESRDLESKCFKLKQDINGLKKKLLDDFSSDAYAIFSKGLIDDAISLIDHEGDIDKGIPGLEASAIEYLLENKKCLCGHELIEGTDEYNRLVELIKYLPPNNIGHEISSFKDFAENVQENGDKAYTNLLEKRKRLNDIVSEYNDSVVKLKELNDQIQSFDDVSAWKKEERDCTSRIDSFTEQKGRDQKLLEDAENAIENIKKERSNYSVTDTRNKKIVECKSHVDILINQINTYCEKKETEKRIQLQQAINSIYKEIFKVGFTITLDENYNITKNTEGITDLSEYETSTSQDAIMAFSFIGGIIKLAREKVLSGDDELANIDNTEPYPLVMDAPSSSFDIQRIENFCHLMPQIAEQVIFFIKDTDGLYVKKYLENSIGKEYRFVKINDSNTVIKEA